MIRSAAAPGPCPIATSVERNGLTFFAFLPQPNTCVGITHRERTVTRSGDGNLSRFYSRRSATIGSSLAACRAGKNPNTTPIVHDTATATSAMPG